MNSQESNKWKVATLLDAYWVSKNIKYFRFNIDGFVPHKAGQHYIVQLTGEDGYQASRFYSVANPSNSDGALEEGQIVEFAIEVLQEGEVTSYLQSIEPGDQLEVQGPLGGHFNWDHNQKDELILIGGGSGIVPLLSIIREYVKSPDGRIVKLIYSAREWEELIFYDELVGYAKKIDGVEISLVLTRNWPDHWKHQKGRIDRNLLGAELSDFNKKSADVYICGRNSFVEDISKAMVELGFDFKNIRGERYG